MPVNKPKKHKGTGLKRSKPQKRDEKGPAFTEYQWLDSVNQPLNSEGIPNGLEDMSEIGAIAWIYKNCKFATYNK